jgi:hypothetical protein
LYLKKQQNVLNALTALNALNLPHRKNVPDRLLMIMKKKVTTIIPIGAIFAEKEIEKKGEATAISRPIPHEKLRRRNEKRLKGIFSSKSVDFFY